MEKNRFWKETTKYSYNICFAVVGFFFSPSILVPKKWVWKKGTWMPPPKFLLFKIFICETFEPCSTKSMCQNGCREKTLHFLPAHGSHSQWHYLSRNANSWTSPLHSCVHRGSSSPTGLWRDFNQSIQSLKKIMLIWGWLKSCLNDNTWKYLSLWDKSVELSCLDSPKPQHTRSYRTWMQQQIPKCADDFWP